MVKLFDKEALQAGDFQSRETLEAVVPFTTPALTLAALQKADQLLLKLDATIRLISVRVVPFPLALGSPPVSIRFMQLAVRDLATRHSASAELYLTREPATIWESRLRPNSLIVIATPKRFWRTPQEKLARALRRKGHDVFCFFASQQ
jgi:hypothetical protein